MHILSYNFDIYLICSGKFLAKYKLAVPGVNALKSSSREIQ